MHFGNETILPIVYVCVFFGGEPIKEKTGREEINIDGQIVPLKSLHELYELA